MFVINCFFHCCTQNNVMCGTQYLSPLMKLSGSSSIVLLHPASLFAPLQLTRMEWMQLVLYSSRPACANSFVERIFRLFHCVLDPNILVVLDRKHFLKGMAWCCDLLISKCEVTCYLKETAFLFTTIVLKAIVYPHPFLDSKPRH